MKLTLKTLKQEVLDVEVDPHNTILQVKEKIQEKYDFEVSSQRLIKTGKILNDGDTVESYSITEKDFLVLMVRKVPARATPAATPAPAPVAEAPGAQPASEPAAQPPAAAPQDQPPAAEPAAAVNDNSMVANSEVEAMVDRISEMGFDKAEIRIALQASFNNPDRAVEYLMTGIPPNIQPAPQPAAPRSPASVPAAGQPAAGQPAAAAQPAAQPAASSGNLFEQAAERQQQQSGSDTFDILRNHPQFNALRHLVQQNPHLLQPMLQQLAQSNPQIFQLIQQNQQEFIRLLHEPVPENTPNLSSGNEISVTQEEKEAIERLEGLGYERAKVIEAFFACDKDENLAANYLLEHGYDDDDDDLAGQ